MSSFQTVKVSDYEPLDSECTHQWLPTDLTPACTTGTQENLSRSALCFLPNGMAGEGGHFCSKGMGPRSKTPGMCHTSSAVFAFDNSAGL